MHGPVAIRMERAQLAPPASSAVLLERADRTAVVTVNRPQALNALSPAVMTELESAFRALETGFDVDGIILTGAGEKAFIAGADISAMSGLTAAQAREWGERGQTLLRRIENHPLPVIAAVNGYALGGGLEIAMACDLIVAAETAKMGQPEVKLGVIPGFGGTQRLGRLVGPHKAKQLCMTGEQITAQEAHRLGLVAEVVPRDRLLPRCREMLAAIRENGPFAVRLVKQVIHRGLQTDLDTASALELDAFALCFATKDQKEGMRAFLEKRRAQFRGE